MSKLNLSIACWDYDRTRPLIDGRVQPEGISPSFTVVRPREIFPRMLQHQEFHASEMSLASYVTLKARGGCPFVAIPVMLSKLFRHGCIYVRSGAGIREPADLRGKRIGVTQYSATAVVFIKGLLQHEYGVLPEEMVWRHPFPGPGLAVRIAGDVTPERLELLRSADEILLEEIRAAGWYRKIAQAFAVLIPVASVGVMGDDRTYEGQNLIVLRMVETQDFMTADWVHIDHDILATISNRIINEVPGVNRVAYDVSSKPPSTIEWQ